MKNCSLHPGNSRRDFFRDSLRFTILSGLAAITGTLIARQSVRLSGQTCINAGICRGCEAFEDCGLPQALSAKTAGRS